jgi:hypothetical protein
MDAAEGIVAEIQDPQLEEVVEEALLQVGDVVVREVEHLQGLEHLAGEEAALAATALGQRDVIEGQVQVAQLTVGGQRRGLDDLDPVLWIRTVLFRIRIRTGIFSSDFDTGTDSIINNLTSLFHNGCR